jgi:hypothetical protein
MKAELVSAFGGCSSCVAVLVDGAVLGDEGVIRTRKTPSSNFAQKRNLAA